MSASPAQHQMTRSLQELKRRQASKVCSAWHSCHLGASCASQGGMFGGNSSSAAHDVLDERHWYQQGCAASQCSGHHCSARSLGTTCLGMGGVEGRSIVCGVQAVLHECSDGRIPQLRSRTLSSMLKARLHQWMHTVHTTSNVVTDNVLCTEDGQQLGCLCLCGRTKDLGYSVNLRYLISLLAYMPMDATA